MTNPREANAVFICGELAGLSMKLDTDTLEKYLEHPAPDFKYNELCKAAIQFARVVSGEIKFSPSPPPGQP